jgi:hypothetical protein
MMADRPAEVAMQVEASNHPKVLQPKAMVSSVGEKAARKLSGMCHGDEQK